MSPLTIIVAATRSNGIGRNGALPWRLSKEMAYFTRVTSSAPGDQSNTVIMGRKTWESIPKKFRPLPQRHNIVVTRNEDYPIDEGPFLSRADSLQAATNLATKNSNIYRIFLTGGAALYSEGFTREGGVDRVLLTRILAPDFDCDTFLPEFQKDGEWEQKSHDELQKWVGFDVPGGVQEEKGIQYEFQMWTRSGTQSTK